MSGYGLFQVSTLGMKSQSHKLNTIGYNIANVNTGGFKRIDTEFETMLSDKIGQSRDYGGVKPYARPTNDIQGLVQGTNRNLDLAIIGDGFFSVQPTLTSTEVYFTRDGSFQLNTVDGDTSNVTADDGSTITVSNGYLVDKNGMFLRGVAADADGTFSSTATPGPMRVDQFAFIDTGQATTTASMELNLPAEANFNDAANSFALTTFDSNGTQRNITFDFSRSFINNQWRIDSRADNLTTSSISPSAALTNSFGSALDTQLGFDSANRTIQAQTLYIAPDPGAAPPIEQRDSRPVAGVFGNYRVGDQITLSGVTSPDTDATLNLGLPITNNSSTNNGTFTIASISDDGSTITVNEAIGGQFPSTTSATIASSSPVAEQLTFASTGQIQTPTELTYTATWDDGATSNFTIDISNFTQFDGGFTPYRSGQDGFGQASITGLSFDDAGHVIGQFSDGTAREIYKVPLFDFSNPNALDSQNGLLFTETTGSGEATSFFADENSKAQFMSNAVEISNVDIAQEFTRMIQTQNAYNMNATTFRTIDEMVTVARDLKS